MILMNFVCELIILLFLNEDKDVELEKDKNDSYNFLIIIYLLDSIKYSLYGE